MRNLLKRYPALSYYAMVFAISWGGMLILIGGPGNIPGSREQGERLFMPALLIMFAGPFLSASTLVFQPSATGSIAFVWNAVLGVVLWIIVAFVAILNPGYFFGKVPT